MAAPSSYDRVLGALTRIFPWAVTITRPAGVAPAAGDSSIGRELGTIAWVMGRVVDRLEAIKDELFPDTADESISRWEKIARVATNTGVALATRQDKVLAVFRRLSGPRLDQLASMLLSIFDLTTVDDVEFVETYREQIDLATTQDSVVIAAAISTTAAVLYYGKPWPGYVDDTGVRIYIEVSGYTAPTVTLTSPAGTAWTIPITGTATWYENRTAFLGAPASGTWTLSYVESTGTRTLTRVKLTVSNTIDSAQIYNFYAFRDPLLAGTPDIQEAQRLFNRTALGHMNTFAIQSTAFIVGSANSLVGRDPVAG